MDKEKVKSLAAAIVEYCGQQGLTVEEAQILPKMIRRGVDQKVRNLRMQPPEHGPEKKGDQSRPLESSVDAFTSLWEKAACSIQEGDVASWENLEAAREELPYLEGTSCVAAIHFDQLNDFVVAGLLFKEGTNRYWKHHTWVCKRSKDLPQITYPLEQDERDGVLTFVCDDEVRPRLVTGWLVEQEKFYTIEAVAIDNFRYTLMADALKEAGFMKDRLKFIRPSDLMSAEKMISYIFSHKLLAWGTSTIMRWYTRNIKAVTDSSGNVSYEKIGPSNRKTEGFFALAAAISLEDRYFLIQL